MANALGDLVWVIDVVDGTQHRWRCGETLDLMDEHGIRIHPDGVVEFANGTLGDIELENWTVEYQ